MPSKTDGKGSPHGAMDLQQQYAMKHGRRRRVKGPNKRYGLKSGESMDLVFYKGKTYRGE